MSKTMIKKMAVVMLFSLFVAVSPVAAQNKKAPPAAKPSNSDCSQMDDNAITTAVKQRLAKSRIVVRGLTVETHSGVVTLAGRAKASQKRRVTQQAKAIPCVKSVTNNIHSNKCAPPCEECADHSCACPPKTCVSNKNVSK